MINVQIQFKKRDIQKVEQVAQRREEKLQKQKKANKN